MNELIIKNIGNPDEVRKFEKGKFELYNLPGMTIGKATYQPGWKWSLDVSPLSGTKFCEVEHLGMVTNGSATVVFNDGVINTLVKGDLFYVPPKPHDSWVVGQELYQSIHFMGANRYAK